ncbi:MAG: Hsp33 family molecular chaperone HslO [Lachnospiraceae bacterium]|nr:Hsp33 family molecular chaperone HslO [Lachnospiraceae bacterium]MCD8361713.1 Hsp33 family molecular chaperone HslO [Lachnospiraceae bacterium]
MSDYIVRATAADGQIRAFAVTARDMVEEARARHNTSPVATAALGRLMSAGAMMGIMMKGEDDLLTLQIHCDGPIGGLTVTADSHGGVKGYVNHPEVMLPPNSRGKLDVGGALGAGTLSVVKDLGLKEPYVGQTELQSGEVAEDLTYYFANSEQTPSSVGLGVLMERDNTVRQAGGFIIQLMPEVEDAVIDRLERKLSEIHSVTTYLDRGYTPEQLLTEILGEFDVEFLERTDTRFYCNCSRNRVEKALLSVGRKGLNEMIQDGKPVEVKCHFCNTPYEFSVEDLKEIVRRSK